MRFILAATALIGLSVLSASAAPAGGSDSDSATMVQPATDNAKYQDKKKQDKKTEAQKKQQAEDAKKTPDDSAPTAEEPNVTPQDQDKEQTQPMPGQEPSPRPH